MNTEKTCPHCGKAIGPNALQGLCPECMLKVGMGTESQSESGVADAGRFVPPAPEQLAPHFPQLEILELLGQGGMGAVYKARQPALDRFVALKILPPDTASDPGFAERFMREARALAKLNHPNIVAVHDFGHTGGTPAPAAQAGAQPPQPPHPSGYHYFIMEFVDGVNLRQLQKAGRLSPREALAIVPQICDALQYAHDEGVVHRDIKPENILVDRKGRVKIADFGLAKLMGGRDASPRRPSLEARPAEPAVPTHLTGTRDVMGTPHYMAPEQIEKPTDVDHRADIYSLGVVFYEMLTGELPLGKFQPPSKKVQVDVRLDEVVLRALEKEPERRYQHASQIKTDVETIASSAPGLERPAQIASQDAWRKGLLWYGFVVSAIGLLVGLALQLPLVWGLSLAGLAISAFRLSLLKEQSAPAESEGRAPESEGQPPAGITRSWMGFPFVEERDEGPVVLWASVAVAWIVCWGILSLAIPLLWMAVGKGFSRFISLPACLGIGALLSVLFVAVGVWWARRSVTAGPSLGRQVPMPRGAATRQLLLPGVLFLVPPLLLMQFVLWGHRALGIDLDGEVQLWLGVLGLPVSTGVGALLAWMLSLAIGRAEGTVALPARWSWLALGAVALLAISLPLGGGAAVLLQLIAQDRHWNPGAFEAAFSVGLIGSAVLTAGGATLLGLEALRRIRLSTSPVRGRRGALAAALFWPCLLAGLLLSAMPGLLSGKSPLFAQHRVTDALPEESAYNPHAERARELLALGRLDDATAEYLQALRLTPANAETRYELANVLMQMGRHADAIQQLREALRLKPNHERAMQWLRALESADRSLPVVINTLPESGVSEVDPGLTELHVTFSKPMQDGGWSWVGLDDASFPQVTGEPRFLVDSRTCVLPVKLEPGRVYAVWINTDKFQNFKDTGGRPAVPYLLIFETRK